MDDVVEPATQDIELTRVLAALADPVRLATIRYLADTGESWCTQVLDEAMLQVTKSTFSHHLRILREAGLIRKRHQGSRGYMRLRADDLDTRFPGLLGSVLACEPSRPALL